MAGTITIDFNSLPAVGDSFLLYLKFLASSGMQQRVALGSNFVSKRLKNNEVTIGNSVEALTRNFLIHFNTDHHNKGGTGNLEARLLTNTSVIITVYNESWEFVSISGDTHFFVYSIENANQATPKTAYFKGYDMGASSCAVPVAIFELTGGSGVYNAYVDGEIAVSGQASPLRVPLDRSRSAKYTFSFTDSAGVEIRSGLSFKTPDKITEDKIKILVAYTDNGATVSVDVEYISQFIMPLSYSLDGITYVEQNVFTGQVEGDYTLYVKDDFGCVTSKTFTVDGYSTVTETNFEISDINPIRYAIVEDGKKNRYNTLSHEQLKNVAYPYVQYFTDKDAPVTQFKTNAKYLNVFALDCYGGKTALSPVQRSNHLGQTYKTTAVKYSTEDNQLGVYFGVVDVLDFLTDELIESKDFGYQIPHAFNTVGGPVTLGDLGTISVGAVEYDESYEAFILKFNVQYTGPTVATTVAATYNVQNYEIYEFVAPIAQLPDSFSIVIEAGKSAAEIKHTRISEKIEKTEDSKNLAEIIYWHTKNLGGMNYATGVAHTLRLPGVLSRLSDMQTVEGYNGDVERYNTHNEVFDGEEYIFSYISEEMARKLRLILTHDMLFINGVLYRLGDEVPELNSRFTTNICELTAILRKGGDLTESFTKDIIQPVSGEGVDQSTYELEQAIAAAKGKALILWKK